MFDRFDELLALFTNHPDRLEDNSCLSVSPAQHIAVHNVRDANGQYLVATLRVSVGGRSLTADARVLDAQLTVGDDRFEATTAADRDCALRLALALRACLHRHRHAALARVPAHRR